MCELPGSSSQALKSSAIITARKVIREREERENTKEGGKTRPSRDGGKDQGKGREGRKGSPKERRRTKGKEKAKTRAKRRRERVLDLQAVMGAAPPLLNSCCYGLKG